MYKRGKLNSKGKFDFSQSNLQAMGLRLLVPKKRIRITNLKNT